ncbi:hypothetical protein MC7420_1371 [Coleofasciculus chthonoplastes PCC 7420]|uniref:Uncharacterized protein n=1 Tax=Coleofasciculus chthonoplastes PCC 7420 TaxID=118168 RepID=B4VRI2_9CYAN|nr:hypothetical protein MC7420_1371 [Coleofasciculus chthonoplastes PCC 7420]
MWQVLARKQTLFNSTNQILTVPCSLISIINFNESPTTYQ